MTTHIDDFHCPKCDKKSWHIKVSLFRLRNNEMALVCKKCAYKLYVLPRDEGDYSDEPSFEYIDEPDLIYKKNEEAS